MGKLAFKESSYLLLRASVLWSSSYLNFVSEFIGRTIGLSLQTILLYYYAWLLDDIMLEFTVFFMNKKNEEMLNIVYCCWQSELVFYKSLRKLQVMASSVRTFKFRLQLYCASLFCYCTVIDVVCFVVLMNVNYISGNRDWKICESSSKAFIKGCKRTLQKNTCWYYSY